MVPTLPVWNQFKFPKIPNWWFISGGAGSLDGWSLLFSGSLGCIPKLFQPFLQPYEPANASSPSHQLSPCFQTFPQLWLLVSHPGSTLLSHCSLQSTEKKSRQTLSTSLGPVKPHRCPFMLVSLPNKVQSTNILAVLSFRELITILRPRPGPNEPRLLPCSAMLSLVDCQFSSP